MIVKQIWTANPYRNFNYLVACAETGEALAIDPLDSDKCLKAAKDEGWDITRIKCELETGRTHQIRVHMAAIGCPVLCDALYSGRSVIEPALLGLPPGPPVIQRQALHAQQISIDHPRTGERLQLQAPLAADMERLLAMLRGK